MAIAIMGCRRLGLASVLLVAVGCGASQGGVDGEQQTPDEPSPMQPLDHSGQTGSPGESECMADADCEAVAETAIASRAEGDPASFRSRTCTRGACEITYVTQAGCSPSVYGPFYDCALDDTAIRERYLDDINLEPGDCVYDPETGTGTCVEPASAENYAPRDPGEWQGMRVDLNITPPCEESAWCGLARACADGLCTACASDSQCASGEGCVLDHCVRSELIECRRAADCGDGVQCVLSGYTGGTARGNEDMRAYCNGSGGGMMR